jgi:hypothetical protein
VGSREPPQPTHCIYMPYVMSFQRLLVQLSPGSQPSLDYAPLMAPLALPGQKFCPRACP